MWIKDLQDQLNSHAWGQTNYRLYKTELIKLVQDALATFSPMKQDTYFNNPIQLIDFFSGAGGTSLGFAALNRVIPAFRMLGGCDINRVSATTYSHNFDTPLSNEDIRELAFVDGRLEEWLKEIDFDCNKPTVLIGCAPCQGFSSHRKKHWDEEEDVRNSLIMAFAKIVEKIQPDAIIIENVPEFLSHR